MEIPDGQCYETKTTNFQSYSKTTLLNSSKNVFRSLSLPYALSPSDKASPMCFSYSFS